ncbi:hypothetical protein M0657_006257 [Pyricularia oryzae]|nr:hypothetical protein M0657_006257 [Pyricularia oryzae]KAI7921167.1 hypothetical protein M9X92_005577 [Pyricularia oryzae]
MFCRGIPTAAVLYAILCACQPHGNHLEQRSPETPTCQVPNQIRRYTLRRTNYHGRYGRTSSTLHSGLDFSVHLFPQNTAADWFMRFNMVSQLDLLLATLYRIVITHLSCPHFYNYAFVYFETGHYLQIGRYTHYNVCIFANLTEIIYNGTVKKCKILFVAQQR